MSAHEMAAERFGDRAEGRFAEGSLPTRSRGQHGCEGGMHDHHRADHRLESFGAGHVAASLGAARGELGLAPQKSLSRASTRSTAVRPL